MKILKITLINKFNVHSFSLSFIQFFISWSGLVWYLISLLLIKLRKTLIFCLSEQHEFPMSMSLFIQNTNFHYSFTHLVFIDRVFHISQAEKHLQYLDVFMKCFSHFQNLHKRAEWKPLYFICQTNRFWKLWNNWFLR